MFLMLPTSSPSTTERPLALILRRIAEEGTLLEGVASYLREKGIYPSGLLADISSATDFKSKIEIANKGLQLQALGSSRAVYLSGPDTVLKVAINPAGKFQNRQEARNWSGRNPLLPQVFQVAPDSSWIEMERVQDNVYGTFSGFEYKMFGYVNLIDLIDNMERGKEVVPQGASLDQRRNIANLGRYFNSSNTLGADLAEISNWGVVMRGGKAQPVLLDSGITREGFAKHYLPKRRQGPGDPTLNIRRALPVNASEA